MNNKTFRKNLEQLINRTCRENASNTPDFILARYLITCLKAFEKGTKARDNWYSISQHQQQHVMKYSYNLDETI